MIASSPYSVIAIPSVSVSDFALRLADRPGAHVPARRGSPKYPHGHGFMAAMRTKASQLPHAPIIPARRVASEAVPPSATCKRRDSSTHRA